MASPRCFRRRSVVRRHEFADAHNARNARQIARGPGRSPRDPEGPHQGRDGLEQPRPRTIQGEPPVGEKDVAAAVQATSDDKLQAESFEYQMRPIVLIVPRGLRRPPSRQKEGGRNPAQPRAELRRSQHLLQVDCSMPRLRETVTKTSADIPAVLREMLDKTSNRPPHRARGHQTGRGDGCAMRTQTHPPWTHRKRRKSGTRCISKNTKQSRKPICRKSAKPR